MTYEIKYRKEGEMKDSGIEWLGKVPKDWGNKKFKYIFNYTKGINPTIFYDYNEKLIPYVNAEYLRTGETDKYVNSYKGLIRTYDKDILLLWDGANAGEIFEGREGALGSTFARLDLIDNQDFSYLKYYTSFYEVYLKDSTYGMGIPHVNSQTLNNLTFFISKSVENQRKIANFLDLKTAEFDSIISKKEDLIEKLEEAKKSLISEVVTGKVKIVDGELIEREHDEMKDSGVQWLGRIPKDWDVKRLKYLVKINPIKSEVRKNNIECSFVPMNKIGKGEITLDDEKLVSEVYDGYTYFRNKDMVMAKVTPCFENGNIAIADNLTNGIAFGTTEINVFRATKIDLNFLYYTFQESHFMNYAVKHMTGVAGLKRIPTTYFENYYIAVPKQTEQKLISEYIIHLFGNIDKIEHKTKLQIQKLRHAKQSLISEAVTGKIDLRDWKIQEI